MSVDDVDAPQAAASPQRGASGWLLGLHVRVCLCALLSGPRRRHCYLAFVYRMHFQIVELFRCSVTSGALEMPSLNSAGWVSRPHSPWRRYFVQYVLVYVHVVRTDQLLVPPSQSPLNRLGIIKLPDCSLRLSTLPSCPRWSSSG